jgi:hypothetical protein
LKDKLIDYNYMPFRCKSKSCPPHLNVQAIWSYIALRTLHLKPQNSISNVLYMLFASMVTCRLWELNLQNTIADELIKIIPSPAAHQDSDGSNINDKMLNVVSALAVSF